MQGLFQGLDVPAIIDFGECFRQGINPVYHQMEMRMGRILMQRPDRLMIGQSQLIHEGMNELAAFLDPIAG